MADLSRKTASIYINHAPAEEALKKLQLQGDKLTASIKRGQDAGKAMVGELAKLNKNKEDIAALQRQIDSGLKPSFNQLQSIVAKTRAELKKMSESDPGFAQKAKDLNKYSTEMNRLGQQIGAVKKESGGLKGLLGDMVPALGLAAVGAGVVGFLKGAVDEALEADKALGKFKGTLDNLGKSEAFDRLTGKAEEMAARFKFLDSPDILGVFDKLITYGKLTEAQIDKLTPVIVNFSVKSKISLDESASVIIKALEGNGKALKEYGINIKDAKTESERLAIVMNDLGGKVNGAADAFGSTTAGKIAITEQSIKDLKEQIGTGLLPVINKALGIFKTLIDELNGITSATSRLMNAGIGEVFGRVGAGIKAYVTEGQAGLDKLNALRNADENNGKQRNDIAEGIATEVGQKSIEQQKVLANAYKNVFIASRKELADFMNSADKDNKERGDKLREQVKQNGKVFISTQRTLNDSIEVERKNAAQETDKKTDKSNKDADRKREEAMRKAMAEAERLRKIWEELTNRINDSFALMADDPVAQGFKKANDQAKKDTDTAKLLLDKRVIDYKTYSDSIVRIEEIRQKAIKDIIEKYKIKVTPDFYMPGRGQSLTRPLDSSKIGDNTRKFEKDQDRLFNDGLAREQLAAITSNGRKKLQAQLNILTLQEAAEIRSKGDTEAKKALIEEEYRQRRAELEKETNTEIANNVLEAAQELAQLFSLFSADNAQADQARLDQNQRNYDEDKNKLDRQLRQKIVSQKEYDRQLRALEEKKRKDDTAIKRKEFERNKQAQIIEAIMNGASAIIYALKATPPFNFIFAGLATALVAAQVSKISAQRAPEYGEGGLLNGPRHSSGGMPVIDPATGRKVMEVEGGEPILSIPTYKNNKSLIDQLLYTSMYQNGARINPYFQNSSSRRLNYTGVTQSMERIRHFESGGIIPGSNSSVQNNTSNPVTIDNSDIIAAIKEMNTNLRAYVLLTDVNAAQDTMDRIRKETTITR